MDLGCPEFPRILRPINTWGVFALWSADIVCLEIFYRTHGCHVIITLTTLTTIPSSHIIYHHHISYIEYLISYSLYHISSNIIKYHISSSSSSSIIHNHHPKLQTTPNTNGYTSAFQVGLWKFDGSLKHTRFHPNKTQPGQRVSVPWGLTVGICPGKNSRRAIYTQNAYKTNSNLKNTMDQPLCKRKCKYIYRNIIQKYLIFLFGARQQSSRLF